MSAEDVTPALQSVPLPTLKAVPLPPVPAPVVSAAPEAVPQPPVPPPIAQAVAGPNGLPAGQRPEEDPRPAATRSAPVRLAPQLPSGADLDAVDRQTADQRPGLLDTAVQVAVGTAWWAAGPLRAGGKLALRAAEAAVAEARQHSSWLHENLPEPASDDRGTVESMIQALLRWVITRVVDAALTELNLTDIILSNVDLDAIAAKLDVEAVIDRVDLDAVVATVDLDAAVGRVDLDRIVDRIDIDGIVAGVDLDAVIDRIDIDGIVAGVDLDAVIDRIDIDGIVKKVDLNGVVAMVDLDPIVGRLDLNTIADGLDLDPLVAKVNLDAVVDRLDIAGVVAKVDPDAVVARVNFEAALDKIDMIGIAQTIVDGIDLPGIIRDSTGSMASEAVHGVRVHGQVADDAVGQFVGRMFRRRGAPEGEPPR